MTPELAALNRALGRKGTTVTLRRKVGTAPNQVNIDADMFGSVRSYQPHELVGGIQQTDSLVIISPTGIANAQWPGGASEGANPTLPRIGDWVKIDGKYRSVAVVDTFVISGTLCRIEMRVLG